jgi:hypothetical protein
VPHVAADVGHAGLGIDAGVGEGVGQGLLSRRASTTRVKKVKNEVPGSGAACSARASARSRCIRSTTIAW